MKSRIDEITAILEGWGHEVRWPTTGALLLDGEEYDIDFYLDAGLSASDISFILLAGKD